MHLAHPGCCAKRPQLLAAQAEDLSGETAGFRGQTAGRSEALQRALGLANLVDGQVGGSLASLGQLQLAFEVCDLPAKLLDLALEPCSLRRVRSGMIECNGICSTTPP